MTVDGTIHVETVAPTGAAIQVNQTGLVAWRLGTGAICLSVRQADERGCQRPHAYLDVCVPAEAARTLHALLGRLLAGDQPVDSAGSV